jgi:predicted nucleotidyltransferase
MSYYNPKIAMLLAKYGVVRVAIFGSRVRWSYGVAAASFMC